MWLATTYPARAVQNFKLCCLYCWAFWTQMPGHHSPFPPSFKNPFPCGLSFPTVNSNVCWFLGCIAGCWGSVPIRAEGENSRCVCPSPAAAALLSTQNTINCRNFTSRFQMLSEACLFQEMHLNASLFGFPCCP